MVGKQLFPLCTENRLTNMSDESQSAYAGRWVARIRGKIVAQGGTPEQALHAAQKSRHKEKPEISYMPIHFSSNLEKNWDAASRKP